MRIPDHEIKRRIGLLQEKLQEKGLDGALIAQAVSMLYFSGTMHCQYVFIPAEGEALGLARRNMERIRAESSLPLAKVSGFRDIAAVVREKYGQVKTLGLELDVLPAALYLRFGEAFSPALLQDVSQLVRETRQVKSSYEIEQFMAAAEQVDKMHRKVPELLCEGKEEITLSVELESILRQNGHQGPTRMRGFNQEMFYGHLLSGSPGTLSSFLDSPTGGTGLSVAQPQGAGRKRIRRHEPVTVDYGGVYNGYVVDQTRLYSIGPLPDKLNRAFDAALEIQEKVRELMVPGMPCKELFNTAQGIARKRGLADYFMGYGDNQVGYIGHGVGLEFNEFPIISGKSEHILEENFVIAVEPKFTLPGLGVVGIENTWLIQKDKPRKICITPDDHVIVE